MATTAGCFSFRSTELASDADLRMNPPAAKPVSAEAEGTTRTRSLRFQPDDRLPPPGPVITRRYKGEVLQVKVLPQGFESDEPLLSPIVWGAQVPLTDPGGTATIP
jgi:hypothetical protein